MKRLVLFVESQGDREAAPILISRLWAALPNELQSALFVDPAPFKVGNANDLTGERGRNEWLRYLKAAQRTRKALGGVLVLLDGDRDQIEGSPFCAAITAHLLATRAMDAGAGSVFSLAVVFLRQEYESLLIAVADQLPGFQAGTPLPPNIEDAPRDAKGWLDQCLADGYRSTSDQARLTRVVTDWRPARSLRSFLRLESAVGEIAQAIATGQQITSPQPRTVPAAEGR